MARAAITETDADPIPPPRHNPYLRGHGEAERTLRLAFESGRLAHAWLIAGPRGIGKATLAYRFARYVLGHAGTAATQAQELLGGLDLGPEPETGDHPSGEGLLYMSPDSGVFHRIAAGGHSDLYTAERRTDDKGKTASEIVVDDIRGVGHFMSLTAGEGGYRVVIVDAADDMNRNAANALLKVLEEPPKRSLLLLVAHNPGRLLPTIRSRCRKLQLAPLSSALVAELVRSYVPEIAPDDARELARLSEGSVGRALTLADAGGLELQRDIANIIGGLPKLDGSALQELAGKLARQGADAAYQSGIELYRWWLSRIILTAAQADAGPDVAPDERETLGRVAGTASLDTWLERRDAAEDLIGAGDGLNLDRKHVVMSLFMSLA
ncbi:MAG: DNA polymerase III subunit delta' [Proteobacteria bacterium]|nr:DNA polymerase III subunit delta' [Pseudomonadota bacterium]